MPEEQIAIESLSRSFGVPTDTQLAKINEKAKRPLSQEEVFVFANKLVGDRLIESRFIKMDKSLLEVYKEDTQNGIAFMLDHSWKEGWGGRPRTAYVYGRSFDATLKKGDIEGETWALHGDFYMVRNRTKEGVNTNDIIADIEDGVLFDTSVGWSANVIECSICGNDIRDYANCDHFPGKDYDGALCYMIAKPPGYLMESSGVFDGAYESAGILSAAGQVALSETVPVYDYKKMNPEVTLYHTYSPNRNKLLTFARRDELGNKVIVNGTKFGKGGEETLDKVEVKLTADDGNVLQTHKVDADADTIALSELIASPEPVSVFMTSEQANEAMGKELSADEVLRLAKEGETYLLALQQEAKEWGVRAMADKFNAEAWEGRFSISDAEQLKGFIQTFKDQADAVIPAGRTTDPEANGGKTPEPKVSTVPDDAYKV